MTSSVKQLLCREWLGRPGLFRPGAGGLSWRYSECVCSCEWQKWGEWQVIFGLLFSCTRIKGC